MSKARELANLGNAYSDGALSNRNLVINGGMQVAQRGNRGFIGFTGSFYAGPDRWLVNRTGTGSTGFSQISSTSYGGTKAAQATFLCAAGEAFVVTQRIEAANIAHLAGQEVTLSFWASGSSDAGSATLNATLSYASAVDNFTTETTISSNSVSYSGTAAYYTFTFTLPAGAANGVGVKFEGVKTDATGVFTLTFGGVQLEAGDTATPFEHPRSYGDELARCQRYFQKSKTGPAVNFGANTSTTAGEYHFRNVVEMRASPTISVAAAGNFAIYSWNGSAPRTVSTITSAHADPVSFVFNVNWSGAIGSAGDGMSLDVGGGDFISVDAEL
jgi:hypothetical protein